MNLQYDRQITISTGKSRKDTHWKPQHIRIGDLWEKLKEPRRSEETMSEYMGMKKAQQDELKDVGGFVGGSLVGERRKAAAVTGRDVVTLDFDTIRHGFEVILLNTMLMDCSYAVYSTRKHTPQKPRLRVLIPLDRTVTPDEYEPIARRVAERIDPLYEMTDPTTFEASRLMYWPSCCRDGDYVFRYRDAPLLCADDVLHSYTDWRDPRSWPRAPGTDARIDRERKRQGDPTQKSGIVGAFCRVYDIHSAISTFLADKYTVVDTDPNRYTYTAGSTTGGAVVYDDGLFLFSHHATDPCSEKLVNAFDLVRLHKYGDLDDKAAEGTPVHKLPSYKAMSDFIGTRPEVQLDLCTAAMDFAGLEIRQDAALMMDKSDAGRLLPTLNNISIILMEDPRFKGKLKHNLMAHSYEVCGDLPWDREAGPWNDSDTIALKLMLERDNHIPKVNRDDCWSAVDYVANKYRFHPVEDYLRGLKWDGIPRLDTLLIDYLGAEDSPYVRAVTRKQFVGAVARVMNPGCKFDTMLVLIGPQGGYKSSLIEVMAGEWFDDNLQSFSGKEVAETLQGKWLLEVAELQAFDKATTEAIKAFLSRRSDRFRPPFKRASKDFPRQCVFFGTGNKPLFLRDITGGRRFWPVETDAQPRTKDVPEDLPRERDQIWAEAMARYTDGEPLFLSKDLEQDARRRQDQSREIDPWEPLILDFLEKEVPEDWDRWDLDKRRAFWDANAHGDYKLVPRKTFCAMEFLCERMHMMQKSIEQRDTRRVNDVLHSIPGWKRERSRVGDYGQQRGIKRK